MFTYINKLHIHSDRFLKNSSGKNIKSSYSFQEVLKLPRIVSGLLNFFNSNRKKMLVFTIILLFIGIPLTDETFQNETNETYLLNQTEVLETGQLGNDIGITSTTTTETTTTSTESTSTVVTSTLELTTELSTTTITTIPIIEDIITQTTTSTEPFTTIVTTTSLPEETSIQTSTTSEITSSIQTKNTAHNEWKEKMKKLGIELSIEITDKETSGGTEKTGKIILKKNNIEVSIEDFNEKDADWTKEIEVNEDVNKNKLNDFLSKNGIFLKDFIWVDTNGFLDQGGYKGSIILQKTYDKVFYCEGSKENPSCLIIDKCGQKPCYQEIDGKTLILLDHFSGGGGGDSTNQYNQSGSPYIVNGVYVAGSASDLNILGEGETYDVEEVIVQTDQTSGKGWAIYTNTTAAIVGRAIIRNWTGSVIQASVVTGTDSGGARSWTKLRCLEKRQECLLLWNDADNDINLEVYHTNTNTWSDYVEIEGAANNDDTQNFDVECEDLSGECLIVYDDDGIDNQQIAYRVYNNSGLNAEEILTIGPVAGLADWIRLYPKNNIDEIMLVMADDNLAISAILWNGTSNSFKASAQTITTVAPLLNRKSFDFAWEGSSGEGLLTFGNTTDGAFGFTYINYAWTNIGLLYNNGAQAYIIHMCGSNPLMGGTNHNYIGIMVNDQDSDLTGGVWDGSAIETSPARPAEDASTEGAIPTENIQCMWESTSKNQAVFIWVDNGALTPEGGTYTIGTGWSFAGWDAGSSTGMTTWQNDVEDLQLIPHSESDVMFVIGQDLDEDIECMRWTGSAWDATGCGLLESAAPLSTFESDTFDWDRYTPVYYGVEVWHNSSTISYSGALNNINITLNFTTTQTDTYSLQIYDWQNSQWTSTGCSAASEVTANTSTQWWCNETTNPTYYNSSDGVIRILINSTIPDSDQGTLKEDYVQYYVSYTDYPPQWKDNDTSIVSGSAYTPSRNYGFQINWTDPENGFVGVDNVTFETNMTTGFDLENITKANTNKYTEFTNNTNGVWWINFTQEQLIGAGNYVFRWYANDSFGFWNKTDQWVYIINKADPTSNMVLTLDGDSSSLQTRQYPDETDVQSSESNTGDGDCTYLLAKNGTSISNGLTDLAAKTYNFTYNTTGCSNYTSGHKEIILNVYKSDTTASLTINPSSPITYGTQTTAYCVSNNTDSTRDLQLQRNTTSSSWVDVTLTENNTEVTLGAGDYKYQCTIAETENFTSEISDTSYYTVNKASPTSGMTVSGTTPINYGTQSDWQGTEINNNDFGCTYNLYRNDTSVNNPDNTILSARAYNYTYNTSGCSNYTAGEVFGYLTVNRITPQLTLTLDQDNSPTQTRQYPNATDIQSSEPNEVDSDLAYLLGSNSTVSGNGLFTFPAGGWNITYNTTGGENYTSNHLEIILTVNKGISNISLFINKTEGDKNILNNTGVNITVVNNVTGTTVWMTTNRTDWSSSSKQTPYENTTEVMYADEYGAKINVTGWWDGNENYTSDSQTHHINILGGILEIELVYPSPNLYMARYSNVILNATVFCRFGDCGDVNATPKYNSTVGDPDTSISATVGAEPFYIQENEPFSMKACPTNPLSQDEFCNITWNINATGGINTDWKVGVLFNSTKAGVQDNHTTNSTLTILECLNDISVNWESISFGELGVDTTGNPALGNSDKTYNISSHEWSCVLDIWIKSTDFENKTYNSVITVGNMTWNTEDIFSTSHNLNYDYDLVYSNLPKNTNMTTYYWFNMPITYMGKYNGTVTIKTNDPN